MTIIINGKERQWETKTVRYEDVANEAFPGETCALIVSAEVRDKKLVVSYFLDPGERTKIVPGMSFTVYKPRSFKQIQ